MQRMKGMLERGRGGAEDAPGQHGGCSGQDRDAGAGLEGRTRDACDDRGTLGT